jgi:hypothetical protein
VKSERCMVLVINRNLSLIFEAYSLTYVKMQDLFKPIYKIMKILMENNDNGRIVDWSHFEWSSVYISQLSESSPTGPGIHLHLIYPTPNFNFFIPFCHHVSSGPASRESRTGDTSQKASNSMVYNHRTTTQYFYPSLKIRQQSCPSSGLTILSVFMIQITILQRIVKILGHMERCATNRSVNSMFPSKSASLICRLHSQQMSLIAESVRRDMEFIP